MNKKLLLLGLVVLGIVMSTSMVSAYIAQGASPYYPWVVVGGRTATGNGAYASAYMPNLIAGTYYGTGCPSRYSSVSYYNAPRSCNSGGSWFSGYNNYNNNYATLGWGGAWGNYGGYNTYGGNVGWASNNPSYSYRGYW